MKKGLVFLCKLLWLIAILIGLCLGTWYLGQYYGWDWGGFWSNFISNAGSSAVIGFVLYWIITRPDEKKATNQRRAQALSMLKIEFSTNLERAKRYRQALKNPENDLTPIYPLRFTRGAWNALKEAGFLPQVEDVSFVYELLRFNELLVVANKTLASIRSAKAGKNTKDKLVLYSKKAIRECDQMIEYLDPILKKLNKMNLPEVVLPKDVEDDQEPDEDGTSDNELVNKQ